MLTVHGTAGAVYVGSRLAATLGTWTLEGGIVTGTVAEADAVYGDRDATTIRLPVGRAVWRWRLGPGLTANSGRYPVSGPPEE